MSASTRLAAPRVESFGGDASEWDALVAGSEQGTICHLATWREVIGGVFGHECPYLAARDAEGRLAGVLPLVRVRSRIFGDHLVSMPFLNAGGPVGSPAAQAALLQGARDLAGSIGADSLELRARSPLQTTLPPARPKVTVLLDLPDSADTLLRGVFRAKLRNQILRPFQDGMEAAFGPEHLEEFYAVLARNFRDLGTPVLPWGLFARLRTAFPAELVVGVVRWEGRVVAGGCGFLWRDGFEITWAGALRERGAGNANMALYWSFMAHLIGRGVKLFDFGRCTPGSGTHRFKQQWRGREVPLPWARWSARPDDASGATERPALRIAAAAWRRMPLPVANRLGPVVARSLPWW